MTRKTKLSAFGTGLLALAIALPATADDKKPTTPGKTEAAKPAAPAAVAKGEKPAASPGWIVVEEDIWLPWRDEPLEWFDDAGTHYRQKEEEAAASELRKAGSWLRFAANHAHPMTKKSLVEAADEIDILAKDLDAGRVHAASKMDQALAKATLALAEWHYFQANEKLGKNDEEKASQHLNTAARYLKMAADSAQFHYGDEVVTAFDDIFGWEHVEVTPNALKANLEVIDKALKNVAGALRKDSHDK